MGCCSRYAHHGGCWHEAPWVEVVDERRCGAAPRRRATEEDPSARRLADLEEEVREVRRLLEDVLETRGRRRS